ncbi:hypothetical protein PTKIN_Ptkin17bG0005700 [Pterospermum kingtungense]
MGILSKKNHHLVKSLSNFRYVCRNTCSINPSLYHIPNRHLHDNLKNDDNNNLKFLLKRLQGKPVNRIPYFSELSTEKGKTFSVRQDLYLPYNPPFPDYVIGSCNGLLCLDDIFGNVVFWNPSTKQCKFLPQSSVQRPPSAIESEFYCTGFGFDPKSEDYKVVRFVDFSDEDYHDIGINQVELYSLKSDSWKEISYGDVYACSGLSINGFYYWLADGTGSTLSDTFILSFDFANEEFSSLALPDLHIPSGPYYLELLEYNGSLAVVIHRDYTYPSSGTKNSFDIWVLNGSWTREFVIESVSGVKRPLGVLKNGDLFFESLNHELLLFDSTTRELKTLGIYGCPKEMQLIPYVESSVPLNGKLELEEHVMYQPDIENKELCPTLTFNSSRNSSYSDMELDDLPGTDNDHWFVLMLEMVETEATRDEMIDCYIKTLAKVVGSEEEAKKRIYKVCYFYGEYPGFGCVLDCDTANKLEELPGVYIFLDSYHDPKYKDYRGGLFIHGEIVRRFKGPKRHRFFM